MWKKQNFVFLILFASIFLVLASCNEGTRTTTVKARPTPLPDSMILPGAGIVKLVPTDISAKKGSEFTIEIHVNTGSQKVAAYGLVLAFDPAIIDANMAKGTNSVDAMPDGYVQAVNATKKGEVFAAGFDVYGKGPAPDLGLVKVNFKAIGAGQTTVALTVKTLIDDKSNPLGKPAAENAKVTVK